MKSGENESAGSVSRDIQKAKRILQELRDQYESQDVSPFEYGKKIEEFREALNLTPIEFANECEISMATYYRWIAKNPGDKRNKPPFTRIDELFHLLEGEHSTMGKSTALEKSGVFTALKTHTELTERQETCWRQWALKTYLPFRAATHKAIKRRLTGFLEHEENANFNCVFYGKWEDEDVKSSTYAAMNSFAQFKQFLYRRKESTLKTFRGWLVTEEAVAFQLGLTTLNLGLTILEYGGTEEKEEKRKNLLSDDRLVDYFFEVPIATYADEADTESLISPGVDVRWIEWPAAKSAQDWVFRKDIFEKLAKGKLDGVEEFLGDEKSLLKYKPKDYPQ